MKTLIRNGMVVDGTGAPGYLADVLIEGDTIARIGQGISAAADTVIDAAGKVVAPGFVDMHRHCDVAPFTQADFGRLELAQGITTTAAGNCGLAPVPCTEECRSEMYSFLEPITGDIPEGMTFYEYEDYVNALEKTPMRLNMGFLAGSGAVKTAVKGFSRTPYSPAEIEKAQNQIVSAMEAGALGVSLGIMYQPELYSTASEMAQVIRPAAEYDGILTTHIRGEGDSLVESVEEVIRIAEEAGLPLNISHFKATGIHNWHDKIFRAIDRIEAARAKGQAVTADFYPYTGGSSMMQSLIPPTVLGENNREMLSRLAAPDGKSFLRQEIYRSHPGWDNMVTSIGWERILISSVTKPELQKFAGMSIAKAAGQLGYTDPADLVADFMVAEDGKVGVIVNSMSQDDVDEIARLSWTALISDGLYGGGGNPHPRLYGAFPRFIRDFVVERQVLDLPTAIHKMTGMPAARFKLAGRGRIRCGCKGDITIFDPKALRDPASYTAPRQLGQGMDAVLVNGGLAWQTGKLTDGVYGGMYRRGHC